MKYMAKKELLMEITAINQDNHIAGLNEPDFTKYLAALDGFCDILSSYEEAAKDFMEKKDYVSLLKELENIRESLLTIHAKGFAEVCLKMNLGLYEAANAMSPELNLEGFESEMTTFFRDISMLSIDIQMALHKEKNTDGIPPDTAKTHGPLNDAGPPSEGPYKILAVDDTSFFLERLKLYFKDTPYEVTFVNSGHTALRFLKSKQPDLFILDINMPQMNGYELAKTIREQGVTKPIIFLTSNADKYSVVKAIQAGGSDFIIKPCTKEQIMERLEKHLG